MKKFKIYSNYYLWSSIKQVFLKLIYDLGIGATIQPWCSCGVAPNEQRTMLVQFSWTKNFPHILQMFQNASVCYLQHLDVWLNPEDTEDNLSNLLAQGGCLTQKPITIITLKPSSAFSTGRSAIPMQICTTFLTCSFFRMATLSPTLQAYR